MSTRNGTRNRSLGGAVCLCLIAAASGAEGGTVEWLPTASLGYSRILQSHAAFDGALRVQLLPFLFVQAEYLALVAEDHTDHGPTFVLGLSGTKRDGLRPFVGVGAGPVQGFAGDDGLYYAALGATYPIARRHRAFIQGELRFGVLGESAYSQFAVGVGLSR